MVAIFLGFELRFLKFLGFKNKNIKISASETRNLKFLNSENRFCVRIDKEIEDDDNENE